MKKVDELIEKMAEKITTDLEKGNLQESYQFSQNVTALAKLIAARANYKMATRYFEGGSSYQIQEE